MNKTTAWTVIIVCLIILGGVYYLYAPAGMFATPSQTPQNDLSAPVATAVYQCDNNHTISATYFEGAPAQPAQPGQPPTPTGSVSVSLDGAAPMTLAQTISADGTRYSDGNPSIAQGQPGAETFVFWSKGNDALVMKNNAMDLTYSNCSTTPQQ